MSHGWTSENFELFRGSVCNMATMQSSPVGAGMEKVLLDNLDLSTRWRDLDDSRLNELEEAFRGGAYGQNVLASPSVIAINGVPKARPPKC